MNALPDSVDVRSSAERADELRAAMTRELKGRRDIRSDTVAAAFATVPRHLFAPEASLESAYSADDPVITKRNEHDWPSVRYPRRRSKP